MVESLRSIVGQGFLVFSRASHTLSEYHSMNLFLMKSLQGLFTDMSNGCSLSVQFGGTCTK